MSRPKTDAEAGRGLVRDDPDPAPEGVRHRPERVEDHDGPPFDRCRHCERAGRIGSINPYEECPARELPSEVEVRAETAEADDSQTPLSGAHVRADGGQSP
jgi:hypothetical protein